MTIKKVFCYSVNRLILLSGQSLCWALGFMTVSNLPCSMPWENKIFSWTNCFDLNWILYIISINPKAYECQLKSEITQNIMRENAYL